MMDLANEDTPQIYSACGKGTRSSMRVLRHGLPLTEMAVSELPGNPNGVWTVKKHRSDEYDTYIIVSFPNATLVLSIGETVEEVTIICILCIHAHLHASPPSGPRKLYEIRSNLVLDLDTALCRKT